MNIWTLPTNKIHGYHSHILGATPLDVSLCHQTPYMYGWCCAIQIDNLTHVVVLCSPYYDHQPSLSLEVIAIFFGYIWLETCSQRHLFESIMCQFGYKKTIHWLPSPIKGGVVVVIDDRWLHFVPSCYRCDIDFTSFSMCI